MTLRLTVAFCLLLGACLLGCSPIQPPATPGSVAQLSATPTRLPTPVPSATPIPTATPTVTPAPTATPTPTAAPLVIFGNPRAAQLHPPQSDGRFPCGVVDTLDFPIDPPDAAHVSTVGQDFGVYRDQYEKYHAGEDWRGRDGTTSLGTPVYSIGHGLVTYANPLGWGRDQGVVIVQHSLTDGNKLLSFYGHLDPPSVRLQPGDCVTRGQQVGEIGRPRTTPHLHFEIRTQSPYTPLTGYWPEDPRLAGWLPPSPTIWQLRVANAPGVQWARPYASGVTQAVGAFGGGATVILTAGRLLAVDVNGVERAWLPDMTDVTAARLDEGAARLYVATRRGRMEAFSLPTGPADTPMWLWGEKITGAGTPQLLPLPGGGIILALRGEMWAFSADNIPLWQHTLPTAPFDWALAEDALYFSTSGSQGTVWRANAYTPPQALAAPGGKLTLAGGRLWIYSAEGIYRLDPSFESPSVERQIQLPVGFLPRGDIAPLADGGVLVAHSDPFDRRLIVLAADGSLRWQRSYARQIDADVSLLTLAGQPYLLAQTVAGAQSALSLYAVNLEAQTLQRLFTGGARPAQSWQTWGLAAGREHILLNIGGGPMVFWSPEQARRILPTDGN